MLGHDSSFVSADIFTQYHRYSGQVSTRGNRLADFLNDPTTEVLELRNVRVTQPSNVASESIECAQLQLKKHTIILAVPTGIYEAPGKRLYSYVEKQHYVAHVMLPAYSLVGTLHLPARANHWMFLCEGTTTASFIPITDVAVRFANGGDPVRNKVVIFHRRYIESLFISERPTEDHSIQDLAAELRALDREKSATPPKQEFAASGVWGGSSLVR